MSYVVHRRMIHLWLILENKKPSSCDFHSYFPHRSIFTKEKPAKIQQTYCKTNFIANKYHIISKELFYFVQFEIDTQLAVTSAFTMKTVATCTRRNVSTLHKQTQKCFLRSYNVDFFVK